MAGEIANTGDDQMRRAGVDVARVGDGIVGALRKARIAERKRVRFAGIGERLRLSVQQVLGQGVRRGHLKRDIVDNLVVRVAVAEAKQVGVRARLVEVFVGGLP